MEPPLRAMLDCRPEIPGRMRIRRDRGQARDKQSVAIDETRCPGGRILLRPHEFLECRGLDYELQNVTQYIALHDGHAHGAAGEVRDGPAVEIADDRAAGLEDFLYLGLVVLSLVGFVLQGIA